MTEWPKVTELISRVMEDVQAVRKGDRNQQQGFNFRGIDAVVNAVGPALRRHGVVVVPVAVAPTFEQYQSRNGATMRNTTLSIGWRFYGPAGDHIEAHTLGEASDAGDKSVSKAHSVAYRTLLLQALCIPTDEADPDASVHERATPPSDPKVRLRAEIQHAAPAAGFQSWAQIGDDFAAWSEGIPLSEADEGLLEKYRDHLKGAA